MTRDVTEDAAVLYQALKLYCAEVRRDKRLQVPPADSVTVHSRQCGSQLTLDARIEESRAREIGYKVRACSLGQAATAIMVRHAAGLNAAEVQRVAGQLRATLAGRHTACDWPELEVFTLAKDMPSRHGSVLLPFEALLQLFDRVAAVPKPDNTDVGVAGKSNRRV